MMGIILPTIIEGRREKNFTHLEIDGVAESGEKETANADTMTDDLSLHRRHHT